MTFDDPMSPMGEPAASSPMRRRRWDVVAFGLVVAGLVLAAVHWYRVSDSDSLGNARVGDCVARIDDYSQDLPYRPVGCTDPAAEYRVLALQRRNTTGGYCRDVAGASLLFSVEEKVLCLGKKDVDPATAVNVAKEGDCLYMELIPTSAAGLEPIRLNCTDPRANLKVLRLLTTVSKFDSQSEACAGVDGFVRAYGFNWADLDNDPRNVPDFGIDVVLCLGLLHPQPPGPSGAPDDPDTPGSPCAYLTAEEVSAAVSRATGRTYTVRSRSLNTNRNCVYQFPKDGEYIETWKSGEGRTPPGTADEELTVDGLPARYGPGEGNRVLSVFLPNSTFTILVRLSGAGDSLSKKVALAVFAAARPRLS